MLAEGFQHTRSKKRYIGLMLAFALISEVPFDIGFFICVFTNGSYISVLLEVSKCIFHLVF
ncbi:TraX family protein [Pilosibacter sp. HC1M1C21]|uniref:TraX family protein n=1 Tax=Pilosibacter sp. HC1M1C21 TaxID=3378803 RepID=UPI00385B7708